MSWCPKCRSEYVNGRETCADCGSVLVESLEALQDDASTMYDYENLSEDMKRRVIAEMQKQKLDPRMLLGKQTEEGSPENIARIIAMENEPNFDEYAKRVEEEAAEDAKIFVRKEEKLKDYRSTGYAFVIVGVAGLAFMLAEVFGLTAFLHFSGASRYLLFTVMIGMFGAFTLIGINAFHSCGRLKKEAESENAYLASLEEWIQSHITAEAVNENIDQSLSIDVLYERRAAKIRKALLSFDKDMPAAILEHYVENTYIALFES